MNIYKDIHSDIQSHANYHQGAFVHGLDDPYRSAAEIFLVLVTYQLDNYADG